MFVVQLKIVGGKWKINCLDQLIIRCEEISPEINGQFFFVIQSNPDNCNTFLCPNVPFATVVSPDNCKTRIIAIFFWGPEALQLSGFDCTSNILRTSPSDRSLEAKLYQDFHQIFSHRHFYSTKWNTLFVKKIVFFVVFWAFYWG